MTTEKERRRKEDLQMSTWVPPKKTETCAMVAIAVGALGTIVSQFL